MTTASSVPASNPQRIVPDKSFRLIRIEHTNSSKDILVSFNVSDELSELDDYDDCATKVRFCGYICRISNTGNRVIAKPVPRGGDPTWWKFSSKKVRAFTTQLSLNKAEDVQYLSACLACAIKQAEAELHAYLVQHQKRVQAASFGKVGYDVQLETVVSLIKELSPAQFDLLCKQLEVTSNVSISLTQPQKLESHYIDLFDIEIEMLGESS
jgi:hypothetical protein